MKEVGGYRLGDLLGAGGGGSVYRAEPVRGGPPVAFKLQQTDDPEARRRFAREAAVMQRIHHPNVVRVLGHGETEDGMYLALELLDGEDLESRIARGPLQPAEVVRVGLAVAAGLGAAHAAGVIHRDVKPSNVFLCADGTIKVLDFGVAVGATRLGETRLTGGKAIIGTPAYMACEQARGTHDEDERTDVWGLGATLYDALAGRSPFDADSAPAVLVRVVTDPPDPLPVSVPRGLGWVILRALEKDPSERWQSMAQMASALTLAHGRRDAPLLQVPPTSMADEVRVVTVLFGDGLQDPSALVAAVRREGGLGSTLLGRRAVGIFGQRTWEGKEPTHAVLAALDVRERDERCRLGVATGRAVRGRAGGITGAVVDVAQSVLSDEGVGVDNETSNRLGESFTIAGGVVLSRAAGTGGEITGVGKTRPLRGRERELADLRLTVQQAIAESQAAGLLVVGPAGIGKSRLRRALQDALPLLPVPPWILQGSAELSRSLEGWHVIADALRRWARLRIGASKAEVVARVLELCPGASQPETIAQLIGVQATPTPGVRTTRSNVSIGHDQISIAVGDLFEALSADRPVVLVVENVQWADAPSIELIEILQRRLDARPFVVVGLARPDQPHRLAGLRRLELGGLSRVATRELVVDVLGERADLDAIAQALHERSGGNPFFVEELAQALAEGRKELPTSVEAAVQTRLDALPREQKDLLRRASVLGQRFWVEALTVMGVQATGELLIRLQDRELVSPDRTGRLPGTTQWSFRQSLVRQVAYDSLTEEQRRHLHIEAAEWLDARPGASAAEVARHFEAAGRHADATLHWERAALAAFEEGDAPQALEATDRVLAGAPDRVRAFRLRALRAEIVYFLGRRNEEAAELTALGALAETREEHALVAERSARHFRTRAAYAEANAAVDIGLQLDPDGIELLVEAARVRAESGNPADALVCAERAVSLSRGHADSAVEGRSLAALGYCLATLGDVAAAQPRFESAIAACQRAGEPRLLASVQVNAAVCLLAGGRVDEALAALHEAVEACRAAGNRRAEGYALQNLAVAQARHGDVELGLSSVEAAETIAREVEDERFRVQCLMQRAAILLETGRRDEALRVLDGAAAVPEAGQADVGASLRCMRAAALLATGRRPEALAEARQALALSESVGARAGDVQLFLIAHAAGVAGALERGTKTLLDTASRIADPLLRRSFLERVPANARLLAAARAAQLVG